MSFPVEVSKKDFSKMQRLLRKQEEVVCLDPRSYIMANLAGLDLLQRGRGPIAKIVKGYEAD